MPTSGQVLGVVLAGGTGSRLAPLTRTINKHILPVNGRPMLYWPLRSLWLSGVRLAVVVLGGKSAGEIVEQFGSSFTPDDPPGVGGVTGHPDDAMALCYVHQSEPGRIGQALGVVRPVTEAVGATRLVVLLGDNVFPEAIPVGATDPLAVNAEIVCVEAIDAEERYGCVAWASGSRIVGPFEKPRRPPPDGMRWFAVTGAYRLPVGWYVAGSSEPTVYRSLLTTLATLGKSARGEVEVTDLLAGLLADGRLDALRTSRPWIDAGEPDGYRTANDPAFWRGEGG